MAENPGVAEFHKVVQPILEKNCYDCHGGGESKAGIAFDELKTDDQILHNNDLWLKVLKNTRAHIMPAGGNPPLTAAEQAALDNWIKFTAFGVDPQNFDPGRVTAHRLNRFEYHNTIRDLLGVDFDANAAFPGDDIGYGFDNIADVLNTSPLLMEKYLAAAQTIIEQAVPSTSRVVQSVTVLGREFIDGDTNTTAVKEPTDNSRYAKVVLDGSTGSTGIKWSYFHPATVSHKFPIAHEGDYKLVVEQGINSNFTYTNASCNITILVDGKPLNQKTLGWHGANSQEEKQPSFYDTISIHLTPGDHEISVTLDPLNDPSTGYIFYSLRSVAIEGPADPALWVHPANYDRFFPKGEAPADAAGRRAYARELLSAFASKAFRRPVTEESLGKLVDIAEKEYSQPGKTFEMGVSQAMVAVLASPRFLFRIDNPEPVPGQPTPAFVPVDEYSLASRLSYFLWSTMPDEELLKLAAAGQLRKNLDAQIQRMVADPRSDALVENFSGQWLQARAVKTVPINTHEVYLREGYDSTTQDDLTTTQRNALLNEANAYIGYVMHNDRSVDELIESNYTFLNSTLANYYFDNTYTLSGNEMRKVDLAPGDWRGGVLTLGSVMMVTSNPTRTSPVKRGKWILDNILDAPAPPPPPNIPSLDEAGKGITDHTPSQREILALHRADPNCSSCHDRMDPLGLALENFNALGTWRAKDMDQAIDASGKLPTGETFKDIRDLKHVIITNHRDEFYRCLTGKMLTYALGRGVEYYDVPTIDKIVDNMDKDGGKFSAILTGIIHSAAFQEERTFSKPLPAPLQAAPPAAQVSSTP